MHTTQDDSTSGAAPTTRDEAARQAAKERAAASAFNEGAECTHCNGSGHVAEGGRLLVHSVSPAGFGADWDLEGLHAAIDKAEYVYWVPGGGRNLVVEVDGKPYRFQVSPPAVAE